MFIILKEGNILVDIAAEVDIQSNGVLATKESGDIVFYSGSGFTAQEVTEIPEWVTIDTNVSVIYENDQFVRTRCVYINQMELRRRFGFEDKIKLDNFISTIEADATLTTEEKETRKKVVATIMKDFDSSNEFWSDDSDFIMAINLLNQYGLLSDDKKNEILCIH
jgi:hypothetical protein